MYVILFNGPPYSGKDTFAQMVAEHLWSRRSSHVDVVMESLSFPLRRIAYAMVDQNYHPETYDMFKETRFAEFDRTGRELMIDVSERFMKQVYQRTIFADMLIARNQQRVDQPSLILVRDSGFQLEVNPIIEWAGREKVFVCQVHRPGCSFDGDSREWVEHAMLGRELNNGTLDDLRKDAADFVCHLTDNLGWKL